MQLTIYLVILWLILTAALNHRRLRRSPIVFLSWLLVTAVMLWPVVRRATPVIQDAYHSPMVQAVVQEARAELDTELRTEFPEFYAEGETERDAK